MSTDCWWTPFPLNFWAGIRPHFLGRKGYLTKGLRGGQPCPYRRVPGAGLVGAGGESGTFLGIPGAFHLADVPVQWLCVSGRGVARMGRRMEARGRLASVGGRRVWEGELLGGAFGRQRQCPTAWGWVGGTAGSWPSASHVAMALVCGMLCSLSLRRAAADARGLHFTVSMALRTSLRTHRTSGVPFERSLRGEQSASPGSRPCVLAIRLCKPGDVCGREVGVGAHPRRSGRCATRASSRRADPAPAFSSRGRHGSVRSYVHVRVCVFVGVFVFVCLCALF